MSNSTPFDNCQFSAREELTEFRNFFFFFFHSEGIATLPSLIVLNSILSTYEIQNILEIGRGIGTLTRFLGRDKSFNIHSVETNEYCIRESMKNLANVKYSHYSSIRQIENSVLANIELVIIDGPIPRSEFKLLFSGDKKRIYFFENHQIVSKARVLSYLFFHGIYSRYVEIFPDHNFEGPSYVIGIKVWSKLTYMLNALALFLQLSPRFLRHSLRKIGHGENPLTDSYMHSKWNPAQQG